MADAKHEAREQECRVRATARRLLAAAMSNPSVCGEVPSAQLMIGLAWSVAEQFEAQAEERWRKLL